MRKAILQGRNGKDDFYAQHSICNIIDLPTRRAQIFHEREARSVDCLCFLREKRAREQELDLFPLQKNRIKWSHFGANYLRPCRVCCRVGVSSRAVKVCQNKQITGKTSDKKK